MQFLCVYFSITIKSSVCCFFNLTFLLIIVPFSICAVPFLSRLLPLFQLFALKSDHLRLSPFLEDGRGKAIAQG